MAEFSRNETILNALLNGDASVIQHHVPQSRNEALLLAIALKLCGMESLDNTQLGGNIVDAIGIPDYIEDVSEYSSYGLTEPGYYVFGRIPTRPGQKVTAETTIEGADGHVKTVGADHVDVAVLFADVATSKVVTINWDGENVDTYVFQATDLAIHNLDDKIQSGGVSDVQVNGTSVVTNGVANVPVASESVLGAVRIAPNYGISMGGIGHELRLVAAEESDIKSHVGWGTYKALGTALAHASVFYGLARAAGADMNNIASTEVGVYPEAQKSAISQMLNAPVTVSGTTPSITAKSGISYVCGEVASLAIAVPESGCFDVVFESGSTPTALTLTLPTGYTLEWLGDFNDASLDASCMYEINIKVVGTKCLGVAAAWT